MNGGKSDRNVGDLVVALNVDIFLFTTFCLKIISGAGRMWGEKYSESSRRPWRRAWRVGGLSLRRRWSMAGSRDGAGEEHFGGRGKIAGESSAVVCLTEESGITLEELLTEEDRTRSESMNASTGGSFLSVGIETGENSVGRSSSVDALARAGAGAGPEMIVPAGRSGAVPGRSFAAGPEILVTGPERTWSEFDESALRPGVAAEIFFRAGTGLEDPGVLQAMPEYVSSADGVKV